MIIAWLPEKAISPPSKHFWINTLQRLTPEQSAAFYEVVKKTPAMQNALQMLLMGAQGEQQAAPIQVAPEELK